jgi:predicted amidohydrolase YtcJ
MDEDSGLGAADLILQNGRILTLDDSDRTVEAVAIRNNRFVAVGATSAMQEFAGENTRIVDLGGHTVLPGLVDAHSHTTGVSPDYLDLTEARSVAEIASAVEQKAGQTPAGDWIIGAGPFMFWRGWDEQRLKEKRLLTRWDLDPVSPNHPVLLIKEAGHALVLNSYALKLAGINKETPDHSGQVVKDKNTGEPTGILLESAMNLVFQALPSSTPEDQLEAAKHASDQLLRMGTTTVANMSVGPQDVRLFQELYSDTSEVHVSTVLCPLAPTTLPMEEALEFLRRWPVMTGFGDSNLKIGSLKVFVDGGITGRAAWFRKPYKDRPDFYGIPQLEEETLFEVVRLADQLGWQVHLHVCGDAAVDLALRALEAAQEANGTTGRRHILTHLYVVSPAMMERMRRLGVVAVLQPNFVHSLGKHMEKALDADQLEHLIPFRSLLEAGVLVALSADGLPQNPMYGIYAAVARSSEDGAILGKAETVTRKEAIRAYTRTSAYALFEEENRGSIEPGKLADLIVLDRDILTVPVEEIKDTQVHMTIKHGKVVFNQLD